ncbi:MAG: helix-turn-helix transcriptional regulator [Oscillospiraceae bacterium]|nr:helix-turn-helix transcriptional regulator [Oscillospiraceae bacterium]
MIEFKREAIGVVIRRLRKERKLSQEVLSGFAGIARSHLAMIEVGTKLPNFETIWALAYAFDIAPHELVVLFEEEAKRIENEIK